MGCGSQSRAPRKPAFAAAAVAATRPGQTPLRAQAGERTRHGSAAGSTVAGRSRGDGRAGRRRSLAPRPGEALALRGFPAPPAAPASLRRGTFVRGDS